jgi:hypothetical protein
LIKFIQLEGFYECRDPLATACEDFDIETSTECIENAVIELQSINNEELNRCVCDEASNFEKSAFDDSCVEVQTFECFDKMAISCSSGAPGTTTKCIPTAFIDPFDLICKC